MAWITGFVIDQFPNVILALKQTVDYLLDYVWPSVVEPTVPTGFVWQPEPIVQLRTGQKFQYVARCWGIIGFVDLLHWQQFRVAPTPDGPLRRNLNVRSSWIQNRPVPKINRSDLNRSPGDGDKIWSDTRSQ